jgi:outer membrane receptor for monomeric catechols
MPAKSTKKRPRRAQPLTTAVRAALLSLEQMSTQRDRENLARFGITASKAFGVSMTNMQLLAKRLGRSHDSPPPSGTPARTRPAC